MILVGHLMQPLLVGIRLECVVHGIGCRHGVSHHCHLLLLSELLLLIISWVGSSRELLLLLLIGSSKWVMSEPRLHHHSVWRKMLLIESRHLLGGFEIVFEGGTSSSSPIEFLINFLFQKHVIESKLIKMRSTILGRIRKIGVGWALLVTWLHGRFKH